METKKILFLMQCISNAYTYRCAELLEKYQLIGPSFHIMMFLGNHPDLQTAKDISELLNLKANVISVHVNRLVDRGYLTRETVPGDRRKVRLCLTEKALPIIESGNQMEKQFCAELKNGLSEDDLKRLDEILSVVRNNASKILMKGLCVEEC